MKRDIEVGERGAIVVEMTISFTLFITMVFSIIYLTNMLILHDKVQTAINSAAHELASYTYFYAALGGRDAASTVKSDGAADTGTVDSVASAAYDTVQKLKTAQGSVQAAADEAVEILDSLENLAGEAESAASDMEGVIRGLAYTGLEAVTFEAKSLLGKEAAQLLTASYIKQGDMDADAYLKALGVQDGYAGLDFSGSSLFCDATFDDVNEDFRMIDLVAEYDVEVGFINLIIPNFKMHMINRVTIPAWLDGDGVKVEPGT